VPIEGSEFTIRCDSIVAAVSQGPDLEPFGGKSEKLTADQKTYTGGDVLGLGLVTIAIAQGRRAAEDIDRWLRGEERLAPQELPVVHTERMYLGYYAGHTRNEADKLPLRDRLKSLDAEVSLGLTEDQVLDEVGRCMSCGYCIDCGLCTTTCEKLGFKVVDPAERDREDRVVKPLEEAPPDCTGCLSCAHICPTGYIKYEIAQDVNRIWGQEFKLLHCETCGTGFFSEAYAKALMKTQHLPPEYFSKCDACHRKEQVAIMDRVAHMELGV
jgi:ferredoxin